MTWNLLSFMSWIGFIGCGSAFWVHHERPLLRTLLLFLALSFGFLLFGPNAWPGWCVCVAIAGACGSAMGVQKVRSIAEARAKHPAKAAQAARTKLGAIK